MVNRLVTTMKNPVHIIIVICAKQLPYQCDQRLSAFIAVLNKKIDEAIHIYKETREKADELLLFQSTYT